MSRVAGGDVTLAQQALLDKLQLKTVFQVRYDNGRDDQLGVVHKGGRVVKEVVTEEEAAWLESWFKAEGWRVSPSLYSSRGYKAVRQIIVNGEKNERE